MDPLLLPLNRLVNLIYYWAVEGLNQTKREEFDWRLEDPPTPPSVEQADGAWSGDAELELFERAATSL